MVKYVIGAVGALLGVLAGAWLMLTPFALAYQNSGADWAEPTYVDFWTGLPLLVVSLVGLILYVSGLVEELRRRGIMRRPYAEPAGQPQAPDEPSDDASGSENNMEQILLPLVTAMLKDMQERDRGRDEAHRETINTVQQARSTEEEGNVRGGNGAASKGRPDRHRHRFLRGDMALPGPFPGRVPEGWVGLDRRHQERPLDRGALIAISALTLLLFAAFALRDAARTAEQKSATEAEES